MFKPLSPLTLAIVTALSSFSSHATSTTSSTEPNLSPMTEANFSPMTPPRYQKDSIIVVYDEQATKAQKIAIQQFANASITDLNQDLIDDRYQHILGGRLAHFKVPANSDIQSMIHQLKAQAGVKYAEPNYLVHANLEPNDPFLSALWGLNNVGQILPDNVIATAGADIEAFRAWDITTGSADVVIGVIDSGIDYTHPDLIDNLWVNPEEIAGNGIDDDNNGVIDDVHGYSPINGNGELMDLNGHGTHVAGTIGATGNNGIGVVGVNWDVTMIGCQFLDAEGNGTTLDAIACIDYFTNLKVNHGINVRATNNSWGGGGYSQALYDAIQAAADADILFVAAAGNGAYDNDQNPSYPSSYDLDAVIAVANTTNQDLLWETSQWGLTSVDLGAPGRMIGSTVPNNGYQYLTGTSMASPHVAGAAALVWSEHPNLDIYQMKQVLLDSAEQIPALAGLTVTGGRLNVARALDFAAETPHFDLTVTPLSQTIIQEETASYDFSISPLFGWNNTVNLSVIADPALTGMSLSSETAVADDIITLSVSTDDQTPAGEYQVTLQADDGNRVESRTVNLTIQPIGLMEYSYSAMPSAAIPDNDPVGISSTIEILDEMQVFGVTAYVDISHTFIGDLIVSLTSPTGTTHTLHNATGGSADDLINSWMTNVFNQEMAQGIWTLKVEDTFAQDTGTLNEWGLTINGLPQDPTAPVAPVAGFEFSTEFLTVDFTNTSTDVNGDIVSYAWDFGDEQLSTLADPQHVYSMAGSYEVTLTVTDSESLTSSYQQTVEVFNHEILAEVARYRVSRRGTALVDIQWQDAMGESVLIKRDGEVISTTNNDGRFRDRFSASASVVTYQVCETGANICSDEITVNFSE